MQVQASSASKCSRAIGSIRVAACRAVLCVGGALAHRARVDVIEAVRCCVMSPHCRHSASQGHWMATVAYTMSK